MSHQTSPLLPDAAPDLGAALSSFSFLATDEELRMLMTGAPEVLARLFPEDEDALPAPVASAVKRSLVARRALAPGEGGELEPLEPWASLANAVLSAPTVGRVSSGDPRADLVVLVPADESGVVAVQREPTGVNTITFLGPGTAAGLVADAVLLSTTMPTAEDLVIGASAELSGADLDAGLASLSINDLASAESALGSAYAPLVAAGAVQQIEVTHQAGEAVSGQQLHLRDAADLGWVEVAPIPGTDRYLVRQLADDAVRAAIEAAFTP